MTDVDIERAKAQATAEQARVTATVQQALRSPLPRFYANNFVNALTDADIMTILQWNSQSVAVLNMNYTVAKTLVNALTVAIEQYEKKFNTRVPDIQIGTFAPPIT